MKSWTCVHVLLVAAWAAASPLASINSKNPRNGEVSWNTLTAADAVHDPVEEFLNLPTDAAGKDEVSPNMMLTFGVKDFEEDAADDENDPLRDDGLDLFLLAWRLGAREFCLLVWRAGLKDALRYKGPFTVFVPTDRAVSRLPAWVKFYLVIHKTALQAILKYHVINGRVTSSQLSDELLVPSLYKNKNLRINIYSRKSPKGAKLITASGSPVLKADNNATNGVIHLVGKVITSIPVDTTGDVVAKCPDFKILNKCLNITGLSGALKGDGPLTLFAPTNEAFKKLPPDVIKMLLNNSTALKEVLLYHVVNLTYYAAGLVNFDEVTTLEGDVLKVRICPKYRVLMVNNARVTYPDVSTYNGVMHSINRVLVPPSLTHLITPEPEVEDESNWIESNNIPQVYEKLYKEKFDFSKEFGKGFNAIKL